MTKRSDERTEFLKDVLITGVETGGHTPWFSFSEYDPDAGRVRVAEDEGGDWQPVWVDRGVVDVEKIASAIAKLLRDPAAVHARGVADEIREASRLNDAGLMDAWSADAVLQVAVFGDVVYG